MMRTARGRALTDRVLAYAAKREREAELQNDRWAKLQWQEVQLTVFQAFYGGEPQSYRFRQSARVVYEPDPKPKTVAQLEMLRAPLRRVVKRVPVHHRLNGNPTPLTTYREVLECGHSLAAPQDFFGETNAARRRCHECRLAEEHKARHTVVAIGA